ncbi:hypothetical protein KHQ81_14045 [Mycoplasmatota bacterium]|nr:hypothetical protein KHQ81_14045 [Mycoplasmatota bacterium]
MKRLSFCIIFSLFLIIGLSTKATTTNTDNDSDNQLIDAGLVPGDFFYFLDRFFENVSLKVTFSDEKKIEKHIKFSQERLAELNEMNPEKKHEWVDKLYDDYGVNLNKANDMLTNLISEGKINKNKKEKLQIAIEDVTSKEEMLNEKIKDKINEEVKDKVKELKVQTYLTAMCEDLTEEEMNSLRENNIKKHDMVRIKALAMLSDMSISDILDLDIFLQDDPTSKKVEKKIDFEKLKTELDIDKEQLINDLKEYHKTLNQNRKAEKEKQHAGNEKGKSQEQIDKIREEAEKRQEEAQKKRDEIKERIKDKMNGKEDNKGNGKHH